MRILIVEDHARIRSGLVDLLESAGHAVDASPDGLGALHRIADKAYDLAIVDRMLPDFEGLEICARIRDRSPVTRLLVLTARGSEEDKVAGLRAGADDYVTKPFGAKELLARVEALGRRIEPPPAVAGRLELGDVSIDLERLEVRREQRRLALTVREAEVLRLLKARHPAVVSRSELLEQVWRADGSMVTRTVDVAIAKLRKKIELDPSRPGLIRTVKGRGYVWGET